MLNRHVLAARLSTERVRLDLTQTELATRVGTYQSHISELERADAVYTPSIDLVLRLATVLGVKVEWLLGEGS